MQPLEEDVDIDADLRRYVTDACARLGTIDHYALLAVGRDADSRTIKRAYLRLVGLVHPDRFFRKRLGSYKAGLQRLFTAITIAHDTLTSPQRRAPSAAPPGAIPVPGGPGAYPPLPPPPPSPPPAPP